MTETVTEPSAAAAAGSKSEQAYRAVKARIVEGIYSPGYRLVLGSIAKDLGVSVVPVREAIRRLEAEGLVTFERNVGATVAGIDPTEYLYTMQTLSIVEGAATALSAPLVDSVAIARARAVNEDMRECLDHFDPVRFTQLNQDFHSILFEHCPNPHILDLVHRGWNRLASLRSSTFRFVPGRARNSVDEHEALLKLIESGADADDIEKAARLHRSATLDAYLAQAKTI
ncbi:GntR family transcriptional regulator [Pseudarthrobacter oxydans]|uniref:GntR family transcriptional regulator n=1 Tax=Pseudarthrobacter oxydans TaxID=1671 RepID=UPI0015737968|nr:GntR family transcriptional regulator [Pseudarthrobacter oxydans]MBA4103109.1 GntR family transcriptional regulator [Arthrobacter sp.]NSX35854.1 GntR family transcriptional regulator [Pseudarthrobacter oxydans]WHP59068.1 GntR family transcriptional regulator [Arthrobacter sp. KFRI-F3372]BFE44034.1 GntR family transcriptional regulator [Pseudarthrobacter oxydans]